MRINGRYGFVWAGNDNLRAVRGHAFHVDSTDGQIYTLNSFANGKQVNVNEIYNINALGDSTFIVYGAAGGLQGAYYTFKFNLAAETWPSDPEIADVLTGGNGTRWDMYVHSVNEVTKEYKLFQSYYSYGVRLWSVFGDNSPPDLTLPTGDGSLEAEDGGGETPVDPPDPGDGTTETPGIPVSPGGSSGFGKYGRLGNSRGGPFGSSKRK